MRILLIAALAIVAAIGGCDCDDGDKATPEAGWSDVECTKADKTLEVLTTKCMWPREGGEGACEAAGQLQADINDNCD